MSPQSNGRVERSVQEIKARIQRALKGAEMGPEFWPAACRFVHQQERRRLAMRNDRPTPPFGKEVLIKKRYWKRGDLEDTHETALYMYQDYENHGHCVLRSDGNYAIAPYYIAQVTQPVDDAVWIAVLEELDKDRDALEVRRRLREKTAVKIAKLQGETSVEEWNTTLAVDEAVDLQKKEREEHVEALRNVLEEEGRIMVYDGLDSMMSTFEEIRKLKKALPQGSEEEDVLRTRIVSVRELLDERERWTEAIQTEMDQLFKEKRALVKIDEAEFKELQQRFGIRLTVVPMKCVLTKKPGPKRRFRMVACGNYAEKTSDDTYAAGADAVSVRYALKRAAESSWSGVVIDVKTAFLNAPLYESEMVEEAVVLKPPSLLLRLGFAQQGEYYKAEKAIYGLRQSPKRWGDFRDQRMHDMVSPSGYYFRQSVTEPNMWRILRRTTGNEEQDEILGELHGLILVYVDDMLILALLEVMEEVIGTIQKEWATSAPEYLRRGKVKYLGMELYETDDGFFASQEDYVTDHLNSMQKKPKPQKCPTIPEMYPEAEEDVDQVSVKEAQQTVGELLWISTRTRPEISFSVSRCCQEIIRSPKWVCALGEVIWGYLSTTAKDGLWFRRTGGESWEGRSPAGLQVYTDISFSPSGSGAISHGSIMVTWNQGLLWWRCSRQAFVTMSTAESELMEAIEGLALGDAVDTLVSEHELEYTKRLWVDNAAAVSVLSTNPCSWRTRHLRLRSHHLQWRLASADWLVAFLPGRFQVADLGTKHLPVQRVLELKEYLGMGRPALEDEKSKKLLLFVTLGMGSMTLKGMDTSDLAAAEGSDLYAMLVLTLAMVLLTGFFLADTKGYIGIVMEKMNESYIQEIDRKTVHGIGKKVNMGLWMVLLMTQMQVVQAQPGEEEEADRALMGCMILYTTVVVLLTLLVQHGGRRLAGVLHGLTSMSHRALREEELGHAGVENLMETENAENLAVNSENAENLAVNSGNTEDLVENAGNAENEMNQEDYEMEIHTTHSYEADGDETTQVDWGSEGGETVDNRDEATPGTPPLPVERPLSPFNVFGDAPMGPTRMLQIPEEMSGEMHDALEEGEMNVQSTEDVEVIETTALQNAPWRTSTTGASTLADVRDGPRVTLADVRDGPRAEPGRDVRERRMVYVTAHGERYHLDSRCQMLARSNSIQRMEVCGVCTEGELDRQTLFKKVGPVLHQDPQHACAGVPYGASRRARSYVVCSECYVRRGEHEG